jgi:hypothetical protein
MIRGIFASLILLSASSAFAAPHIEPKMIADSLPSHAAPKVEVATPEIELTPIVVQQGARFFQAIVTDVDLTVIEIFSI